MSFYTPPLPSPPGMKVESVLKLRSGGAILHLNSLEAANWIRSFEVEMSFTESFAEFAYFKTGATTF